MSATGYSHGGKSTLYQSYKSDGHPGKHLQLYAYIDFGYALHDDSKSHTCVVIL